MVSVITKVVAWIDFRIRSKESINNSFKKIVNNLESNSNLNELPKKIQKLANYILTDRYKKLEIEDRDIKQIIALLSPQVIKEDPLVKKIVETLKIKLGRVEQSENNVPPPPTKPTNQSQNNPVSNQNNLQKPPPFPGNQPKKGSEGAPPPPPITGQQKNKIPAEQPKAKGEPKFFSSFKELNDEIKKNEADLDKFKNEHNDNFFNFKNFVQLNESLLAKFDEASKKVATNQAQQPKCENINNKIVLAIESLEIGQQTNQPVKLSFLDKNSKLNKTIIFLRNNIH